MELTIKTSYTVSGGGVHKFGVEVRVFQQGKVKVLDAVDASATCPKVCQMDASKSLKLMSNCRTGNIPVLDAAAAPHP